MLHILSRIPWISWIPTTTSTRVFPSLAFGKRLALPHSASLSLSIPCKSTNCFCWCFPHEQHVYTFHDPSTFFMSPLSSTRPAKTSREAFKDMVISRNPYQKPNVLLIYQRRLDVIFLLLLDQTKFGKYRVPTTIPSSASDWMVVFLLWLP